MVLTFLFMLLGGNERIFKFKFPDRGSALGFTIMGFYYAH